MDAHVYISENKYITVSDIQNIIIFSKDGSSKKQVISELSEFALHKGELLSFVGKDNSISINSNEIKCVYFVKSDSY